MSRKRYLAYGQFLRDIVQEQFKKGACESAAGAVVIGTSILMAGGVIADAIRGKRSDVPLDVDPPVDLFRGAPVPRDDANEEHRRERAQRIEGAWLIDSSVEQGKFLAFLMSQNAIVTKVHEGKKLERIEVAPGVDIDEVYVNQKAIQFEVSSTAKGGKMVFLCSPAEGGDIVSIWEPRIKAPAWPAS